MNVLENLKNLKITAGNLSYFNAGEGESYRTEQNARDKARAEFINARKTCTEAGISEEQIKEALRGYLV